MRLVEFTRQGSNTIVGNFGPGDIVRCGDALARHFVEEVKVADYADAPISREPAQTITRKRGGRS